MRIGPILSIIFIILSISVVLAAEYQIDMGYYIVKFNSSQELVILPPLPHEESGSHAGGWDIKIQDNMSHSIAYLGIIEVNEIVPLSNEVIRVLLDSNMKELSGLKPKKIIKVNGVDGLISGGYNPQFGMDCKLAIFPFSPFYDLFYNRMATKCFIVLNGYDLPAYSEILNSLSIETNQGINSSASNDNLNAEAWNNRGDALYAQGKYEEAIEAFNKAIELKPLYETAWAGKGMTLGSQGKYDEAIVDLNKAIEINPRYAEAWASKALALQLLGKTEEADEAFAKANKFGFSDVGGFSWLLLKPLGVIAQVNASPEKILGMQFNASSVEKLGQNYVVIVPGINGVGMAKDLGYIGAKTASMEDSTKITIATSPESIILNYLKKNLDADVKPNIDYEPIRYEILTNVSKESLNAILAPVGGNLSEGEDVFVEGVSPETLYETKKILDSKLNRLGVQDANARVVDNKYLIINLSGIGLAYAQEVVGKPGKFEIRIQTENNDSMHVLYGDAVESVEIPAKDYEVWGVPFGLSEDGSAAFQKAAIDSGATKDPEDHYISIYLDKEEIFSAPLAPELASSLNKTPTRKMQATVGSGEAASEKAKMLYIHLKEGALPVNFNTIWAGMRQIR